MTMVLYVEVQIGIRLLADAHGVISAFVTVIPALQLVTFHGDQRPIPGFDRNVEVRVTRQYRS